MIIEHIAPELIRTISEHVSRVIQDYVENDADAMLVSSADHGLQVVASTEARVNIEKILNAVAVVRVLGCDLSKDRTDPDR